MRAKPRRHRPGDCQPVANLVAAVSRHRFEVFVLRIAGRDFGNLAALETLEEPTVELLVDPAGLRRPDPMRKAAGTEKRDALVPWPALDALADERANVEASLGSRHRGCERVHHDGDHRDVPARGQMNHRGDFGMVQFELFGKGEVDAALESLANDIACEITGDGHTHFRYVETRNRRSDGLFAYADEECRQIVEEAAVEMIVGKRDENVGTRIFEDLTRAVEARPQTGPLAVGKVLPILRRRHHRNVRTCDTRNNLCHGRSPLANFWDSTFKVQLFGFNFWDSSWRRNPACACPRRHSRVEAA